jgi:hypothetical protein
MALRVIGSGLGRTGTTSLKAALELLLGGPCYHMSEVRRNVGHTGAWHRALTGGTTDWDQLLDGFLATVDWPGAAFWPQLLERWPDALVLHSERDPDEWYRSVSATILPRVTGPAEGSGADDPAWLAMSRTMFDQFTPDFADPVAAKAAFGAWTADVRARVPAGQLTVWRTGDGWEPICRALDLPLPDEPFPHRNTTAQFRQRHDLPTT